MLKVKEILAGNQRSGARMIRLIEDNDPNVFELLKELYSHAGHAFIIGITGSPGVGKSTLIDALISEFRKLDLMVAVIAVDPTSPFSGGAILGDRLRMQRHATDKGVFIRSMASRGQKGGLSRATKDAAIVLDAMGYEMIIIETVGAGQADFDITTLAHSTGIVTIPGTGDGIQAVKAGILETGDVFIVNKSDKPDADASVYELKMMISMRKPPNLKVTRETDWTPRVLKTIAQNGTGVKELANAFLSHFDFMKKNSLMDQKRKEQELLYFKTILKDLTLEKLLLFMETSEEYREVLKKIQSCAIDPLSAAELVFNKVCAFEKKLIKDEI
ncbi:methylmalonyl Co-A mutase-associated GTPase MeaB [Desulfobacula sp.]|uniref:methylmalonyl Co-A mutase-associated GTPase MeaB n=1 Tax=Desulfobacula sp. TaxID=2593537 RepID=UPI0025C4F43C|nr:methylmalonyl Co-A mutase-associated GTPase MeaB [Desulfobacula sp.]